MRWPFRWLLGHRSWGVDPNLVTDKIAWVRNLVNGQILFGGNRPRLEEERTISQRTYHHGNLRRTIIDAAVQAITESGPAGWSLRELARRANVSHAAPAHHFGDKTGLLTAVAAEGFELFADALARAGDDLLDLGTAYVRFATDHRAYFEVMFRPELYRADDPEVTRARARAGDLLTKGTRTLATGEEQERTAALAAWSIVHGFSTLWLSGALPDDLTGPPETAARPVLQVLFKGWQPPTATT